MSIKEPDVDLFYHLETSLHRPEVRTSALHVAELLTDEFVEFGKSGRVYDRQVTIDALSGESVSGASIVPQVTDSLWSLSRTKWCWSGIEALRLPYPTHADASKRCVARSGNSILGDGKWFFIRGRPSSAVDRSV